MLLISWVTLIYKESNPTELFLGLWQHLSPLYNSTLLRCRFISKSSYLLTFFPRRGEFSLTKAAELCSPSWIIAMVTQGSLLSYKVRLNTHTFLHTSPTPSPGTGVQWMFPVWPDRHFLGHHSEPYAGRHLTGGLGTALGVFEKEAAPLTPLRSRFMRF